MQNKNSSKSSLSIGGRMTPKAANVAGIILSVSALIAALGIAIATVIYACH